MDTTTSQPSRVALVTGANRGLGHAIAAALARPEHGLRVVITARLLADAEAAAQRLAERGLNVAPLQLDVTDTASTARLFADVETVYGRLDVMVANSAVAIDRRRPPSLSDMDTVRATLDTNLVGAWRCCVHALALMRQHHYGRITAVSSHLGSISLAESSSSAAYRVSKAGLNQLTRILAAEIQEANAGKGPGEPRDDILINAASPGTVDTRMGPAQPSYTPEQAAESLLWLSLLDADGPSGGFYFGREPLPW
jgi:NAD(P)-dependent dehydrogenase (short-subunit alcohol dehydrogenase family)